MNIGVTGTSSFDPTQMASKMFKKADSNGDDGIDKAEFKAVMSKRGIGDGQNTDKMFERIDANSDGKINKAENEDGMKKIGQEMIARLGKMRGMSFGGANGTSSAIDSFLETHKNSRSKSEKIGQEEDETDTQISRLMNELQTGAKYGQSGYLSFSAGTAQSLFSLTA